MNLRFGILWPLQNPSFDGVAFEGPYGRHVGFIADSEAMGYDYAWLTGHHFVEDGHSPPLLPRAADLAPHHVRSNMEILVKDVMPAFSE
jgi:alkanesulfonate monooxygenase SsuD/methylene tetrahydromethanopterin reductase-like flavin-dependent oxidoreductase (luciferase family)